MFKSEIFSSIDLCTRIHLLFAIVVFFLFSNVLNRISEETDNGYLYCQRSLIFG